MNVDDVARSQGRQGTQAIAAPTAGGGNGYLHAQFAKMLDHLYVEIPFQIVKEQLGGAMLPRAPGEACR
ncbi:hypothetical protein D3C80_2152840 [compost metagenome]